MSSVAQGPDFTGNVLVLLEQLPAGNFAAMTPQFEGVAAIGGTRHVTLRILRTVLLAYIRELAEDYGSIMPGVKVFSSEEAETLRVNLECAQSLGQKVPSKRKQVSIEYLVV